MRFRSGKGIFFVLLFAVVFILSLFPRVQRSRHDTAEGPARDWFYRQRAYPGWTVDQNLRLASLLQARSARVAMRPAAGVPWTFQGPTNVGGRITALDISRQNPNILYAGAADGGVLKSTDAGVHWTPLFDDQISLSIGALAVDPGNDRTVYVGTGEANSSGDSYDGFGMVKTNDGGATWIPIGLDSTCHIGRIVLDPRSPQTLYVAALGSLFTPNSARGVFKSTDAGISWSRALYINDSTGIIDIAIDPLHPDTLLAAAWQRMRGPAGRRYVGGVGTGIYRTTDAGAHWLLLSNGLPAPAPNIGRPGVAIAPTDPLTAYVCYADDPGEFLGVYRTTDGGDQWTRTNDTPLSVASLYNGYGWYFGGIYVSPSNPLQVYVLGLYIGKTSDGGASWTVDFTPPHVDHHAMAFDPSNPNVLYTGNDGGRAKSTDGGASWFSEPDQGLPITQFYAGCIDYLNPRLSMGGTQDNGTPRTSTGNSNDWYDVVGGDGFYSVIDYTDDNYQYAEIYYGTIFRTANNWQSSVVVTSGLDPADRFNWSTPIIMDPVNPQVLYTGSQRVYRTTDRAQTWTPISGDLTNGPVPGFSAYATITTIDVAPADSNTLLVGTDDANVWVTTDGGAHWTNVSSGLPNRWITRVRFDPADRTVAYVTCSGYRIDTKLPHVFRTTDLGAQWQDISAGLPEAPVNVILVDPQFPDRLYVGTDVGPWFSTNTGASWSPMGTGVPNVVVADMQLYAPGRIARIFTHGRSMWEIDLNQLVSAVATLPPQAPATFTLLQNYPNPFNPTTTIAFSVSVQGSVRLAVSDLTGREIRTLLNGVVARGAHTIAWDGRNDNGREAASGIYLCTLTAGSSTQTTKMLLLR